jgi:hypothetical protein
MKMTLGADWAKFFDIVIADCQKPIWQRAENPFVQIEKNPLYVKGQVIKNADDFLQASINKKKLF